MTSNTQPARPAKKRLSFFIPEGDEQPFRYALYNVALLVFLALCLVAVSAVFLLFHAFLKPMAWAALVGTLIFPLKNIVSGTTKSWLRNLKETNTPLIVGFALLPFRLLDSYVDALWDLLTSQNARYLLIVYPVALILAKQKAFSSIFLVGAKIITILDSLIGAFSGKWIIPLLLVYVGTYIAWLWLQGQDSGNTKLGRGLAMPAWIVLFCVISNLFGAIKVVVFLGLVSLIVLSEMGVIGTPASTPDSSEAPSSMSAVQQSISTASSQVDAAANAPSQADLYIQYLLGACALLWFATHLWLLSLLVIPLVYMIIKKAGSAAGLWQKIGDFMKRGTSQLSEKGKHVTHTAVPKSVRNLARVLFTGDQAIIDGLEQSMDILSSIITMILVLIFIIVTALFVGFQLHNETVHLIELSSNVWEQTGSGNETGPVAQWIHESMESALGNKSLDQTVDEGYQYARIWLSDQVKSLVPDDPAKGAMLESEVKQLIDRIYKVWTDRQKMDEFADQADEPSVSEMVSHLSTSFDVMAFKDDIMRILQENMETLTSVMQSLMGVIQSNMSLFMAIFAGLAGVIMSFGFQLVNFVVSSIVFLTVLYYLLATSKDQWKPLEMFSKLTPYGQAQPGDKKADKNQIARAIEESIKGVFILSIKKTIFYGAYTWFIHTLFDLNIEFLPSRLFFGQLYLLVNPTVIAALLAAVPLTATFWVSIPGVLELTLVRGQTALGVIFFIANLLPTMVVDGVFIEEVKGSHPYLTGLAIIGGMYRLGLSGAIVGPLVLCICLVIFKIYRSLWSQDAHFAAQTTAEKEENL